MNDADLIQAILNKGFYLADRWRLQGKWRDANTLVHGLFPAATSLGNESIAELHLLNGRILLDEATFGGQDTLQTSDDALNHALDHAQEVGNSALIGAIWDAKGSVVHSTYLAGDRSQELENELIYFERGLDLHREANEAPGIAESLFHVGLVYGVVRRDHGQALPYFEESYALAMEAGDPVIASYAIRHIAVARHEAGEGNAAYAAMAESLQLREMAGFVPGVAMALHTMAYAESEYGDSKRVIPCLERARGIFEELGATKYVDLMNAEIAQHDEA